ncbi:hypothetical protein BU24DRAFT_418160 [Aaosphaeria arxii CBS 175.79]|uniref:ABM domain-containing protein n=1 Tax=Aaosphaeria arxii CBS 175.79 TaxID=1450172 RepID=A0A6A5Y1E8_9PLEO|nr:uncharacterized protein BU24DRAFT_418160 [Aaosphaeria arxii CBS 175.79]KAF2018640.1 hypothetical protein BU24DRAFT_418160 [Aaosphaeria arxii CBS 175.79]
MAITEIALLHLLPNASLEDPALRSKLANAKAVMEKFTGREFHFLRQTEDPTFLYIIGEWDSLDQHMNQFIPSAENQALLEDITPHFTVDWLVHIDAPHAELPIPKATNDHPNGSHIVSISRLFIQDGQADNFRAAWAEGKHVLEDFVTEGKVGFGFRIDVKEGERQEFFLWSPWKDEAQHHAFVKVDGFEEFVKATQYVTDPIFKHATVFTV